MYLHGESKCGLLNQFWLGIVWDLGQITLISLVRNCMRSWANHFNFFG
jgi:hypothetical protein